MPKYPVTPDNPAVGAAERIVVGVVTASIFVVGVVVRADPEFALLGAFLPFAIYVMVRRWLSARKHRDRAE